MGNEVARIKQPPEKKKLVTKFAEGLGVQPEDMLKTLQDTAFKQRNNKPITTEQMMALLVVADKYGLNPFVKEIYAFADGSGIVPIVGVDGWASMINNHPQFDGLSFEVSEEVIEPADGKICPAWMKCIIYRKDRKHPIEVTEYLDEVYRPKMGNFNGPWQTHTKRMLRHKAMIQCARVAFGYTGIHDEDEAYRVVEAEDMRREHDPKEQAATLTSALSDEPIDAEYEEKREEPAIPNDAPLFAEAELAEPPEPEDVVPEEPVKEEISIKPSDVLNAITQASSVDELDAAYDLVNDIDNPSKAHKSMLTQAYHMRKTELEQA